MYFVFTQKATVLFKGWEVDSVGGRCSPVLCYKITL